MRAALVMPHGRAASQASLSHSHTHTHFKGDSVCYLRVRMHVCMCAHCAVMVVCVGNISCSSPEHFCQPPPPSHRGSECTSYTPPGLIRMLSSLGFRIANGTQHVELALKHLTSITMHHLKLLDKYFIFNSVSQPFSFQGPPVYYELGQGPPFIFFSIL